MTPEDREKAMSAVRTILDRYWGAGSETQAQLIVDALAALFPAEPVQEGKLVNTTLGALTNTGWHPPMNEVRKMAERWWITVCPACNGQVLLALHGAQTHNETCPNRDGRLFVPRNVEVVPARTEGGESQ